MPVKLTRKDIDGAERAGLLLGQIAAPTTSFTADGADDQNRVFTVVAERHPDAAPSTAAFNGGAERVH